MKVNIEMGGRMETAEMGIWGMESFKDKANLVEQNSLINLAEMSLSGVSGNVHKSRLGEKTSRENLKIRHLFSFFYEITNETL